MDRVPLRSKTIRSERVGQICTVQIPQDWIDPAFAMDESTGSRYGFLQEESDAGPKVATTSMDLWRESS